MKHLTINLAGVDRKVRLNFKVLSESGLLNGATLEAIARAIHGGLVERRDSETLEWVMDCADPDTLTQFTAQCRVHYPTVFGADPLTPQASTIQ